MSPEVEIKFACGPSTLEALAELVIPGSSGARDRQLVSVYYDTPEGALAARKVSLRLRTDGSGRTIQTLKTGDGLGRREAEHEVAAGRLDAGAPELAAVLSPADRSRLAPRFTVRVRRRTRQVPRGESRIELALDLGDILAGEARRPVCEAEVELVSGDPGDLFDLALELVADLPLTLSLRSKSDRGVRLAGGQPASLALAPDIASGEALRLGLLGALEETCDRLREAAADPAPQAVHALRVAVRRLRSLLAVFRRRFAAAQTSAVRAGLRDLSRASGPVRELDILLAAADPAGALHAELLAARRSAALGLVRTLEAAPARRLLLEGLILAEAGAWRSAPASAVPAESPEGLTGDLSRRWRRIRRLSARFPDLEADERHGLRLRLKALRYAIDGLDLPAWAPLRKGLVPALRDAQDALGAANDAEAAEARLAALDLSRDARREARRLLAGLRRKGEGARAGRAVRRLLETPAPPLT